jgi:sterol 3beta-glucosyltransferase
MMVTVVIAAFGTRGDVAPLTGIGCRLAQAGHEVVMTAPSEFSELITGCGLRCVPHDVDLGLDVDLADVRNPRKAAMKFLSPTGMWATGEALLAALRQEAADVLMLSPFAEFAGHPLAEARGIPSIGVRLQPLSTTAAHPPVILGAWSAGGLINRTVGRLATATIDRLYSSTIAAFRDQLGLPRVPARTLRRRRTEAEWPILYGFSPHVVPRPADWRPGLQVVGYWWPPRPLGWQPPDEVVSFLESGDPPVFLSLGSVVMSKDESTRLSEVIPAALRKAGVRGLVQAGWAGLDVASADILTIGDIPHDWLFTKVAAVVHACGAGITAAGLRAGQPAIAVPEPTGDQPFWARRLRHLGVTAATLSRRTLTADRLATAIDTALTNPTYRDNAQHLAAKLADEDGTAQALTAIEQLLSTR